MKYRACRSQRVPAYVWLLVAVAALFGVSTASGGGGGRNSTPSLVPRAPLCTSFLQSCIQPPPGMAGWWSGDGDANDISGSVLNGALEGGARFSPGRVSQGFELDGIDGRVRIGDSPILHFGTGDVTVDAWIKAPPGTTTRNIIGKEIQTFPFSSIILRLIPGGRLQFAITDCGTASCGFTDGLGNPPSGGSRQPVESPSRVDDDVFHHVAGVRRPSGYELYVDGQLVATRLEPARNGDNSAPMFFGVQALSVAGVYFFPFQGIIDEVEMFNRALTASEIQSIFDSGSAGKCKDLTSFCGISVPDVITARPGRTTGFIISNDGPTPETVTIRPFFEGACFAIFPGAPQQVVIPPGGSYPFLLDASSCPSIAGRQAQNSLIVIEANNCETRYVQVAWVLRG